MAPKIITPANPLLAFSVEEARFQCSIDGNYSDAFLTRLIKVAFRSLENQTGRALHTQTVETFYPYVPQRKYLELPPLVSVTWVKYFDNDDVQQTLDEDSYRFYTDTEAYGSVEFLEWPSTKCRDDALTIRYVCGYSTTPEDIVHAIALLVSGYHEHREAETAIKTNPLAFGVDRLIAPYIVYGGI